MCACSGTVEWSGGSAPWSSASGSPVTLDAWTPHGSSDSQQAVVLGDSQLQLRTSTGGDVGGGRLTAPLSSHATNPPKWAMAGGRQRSAIDTVPEGEELSCAAEGSDTKAAYSGDTAAAVASGEVSMAGGEGRQRGSSAMESTMRGRGRLKYQGTAVCGKPSSSNSGSCTMSLLPQHLREEGSQGEQQWLQELQRQWQQPLPVLLEEQEQQMPPSHPASKSKSAPGPSSPQSSLTPYSAVSACADACASPSSTSACGISGSYIVVDPCFREHFELRSQCTTPRYEAVLALLPKVYVGHVDRLPLLVELLCEEMTASFKVCGVPLPPWRKLASLLSKWHLA
ncbi:hypothetical protein DUNSADRAFT_18494 [Dunaliella salina]|uniref:Uncharacterized protein n=1 Tax=Dunaliella salina TaxID=3046 RepID=A0ABQ7GYZ5_DUNSA|nr:hypothetical protein DUNSADRAFT_18494 [Dunaliella salina]|eukprot:KAF5839832.1 hypothetical protein DUNSADRAFT_18494 [Dunaliella salina]